MALSAAEIACKHRHLYLLQKVKGNKTLTAAELKELKNYEEMAKKTVKTGADRSRPKPTQGRPKPTRSRRRANVRKRDTRGKFEKAASSRINEKQIKEIAAELKSLAAMDEQFESHFDGILEKYPRIKKALEQAIAQRVEDVIQQRFTVSTEKDYRKITLKQLVEITGRTRQTIYDWLKKGLPRNADGNFELAGFIGWFEKYTVEKLPAQVIANINPLQSMKAERLELDIARQKNQLLERGQVMAGQIARHQNLINSLSHKAEELALICSGQPQAKMAEILNSFFDEVLGQQCQVPEQLRLPEEAAKQFAKLLKGLRPEGQ